MIRRAAVRPVPAVAVAIVLAAVAFHLCGCESSGRTTDRPLAASLHTVDPAPRTAAQAAADRDRLLEDIRLHLTAITGRQTGSTHPTLQQLLEDAEAIREGVRTLRLEMQMHGLGFEQSMEPFLRALDHHYTVLAQIRDELAWLRSMEPPSASGVSSDPGEMARPQTRPEAIGDR